MQAPPQAPTLRPFVNAANPSQRAAGAGFVLALHVGLVLALLYGLQVTFTPVPPKGPIHTRVIIDETDTSRPPPPPVHNTIDTRVFIPDPLNPDTFQDEGPGNTAITATNIPPRSPLPDTPAQGILSTHTIPPYPPISIRLNEQGVVTLRIAVSDDGLVTDATVIRSSGFARLDAAAIAWVKSRWRYRPAQAGGRAVASTAQAEVRFELH